MASTTLRVTTTRLNVSTDFYKDVNVMNYVLNEYILTNKLVAVTKISEDELSIITTLNFSSFNDKKEFLSDPIIQKFSKLKRDYSTLKGIVIKTEEVNEQNS